MPRGKLSLFQRANHNRHIAIETEHINLSALAKADFQSMANIPSSALRFASFPGRFGDETSAFLVAVNHWSPKFFVSHHAGRIETALSAFHCPQLIASRP